MVEDDPDIADLMRRYLADPLLEAGPDSPEYREAERVVALPQPPSSRLDIQGARGTYLKISVTDGDL